jgi:type IV pilus assembly protein PilF
MVRPPSSRPARAPARVPSRARAVRSRSLQALALVLALGAGGCVRRSGGGGASLEDQSVAQYDLGVDAFQHGRLREALDQVQKALRLDEGNADAAYLGALVMLAFCAQDESSSDCRYPQAEVYARQAVKADPELRDAINTLGVVLIQEGRHAEAVAVLEPLSRDMLYLSPEKSWGNLGLAYLQLGRVDAAIDALRRAVSVQPLFCVGQHRLGLAFEKKGDDRAARDAFARAVETNAPACQRLQDAFEGLGRTQARLGRPEEARVAFARCRDIARNSSSGQRCAVAESQLPGGTP